MKDEKKIILLVGPYPPPEGGVSVHLQRLLRKSAGHPWIKLAIFDVGKKMFIDNEKRGGLLSAVRYFLSASIIHIHLAHPYKVFIGRMAKLFRKKVFFTQHNSRLSDHSSTKRMIQLSDKTIFVYHDNNFTERLVIPAYIPADDPGFLPEAILSEAKGKKVVLTISSAPFSHEDKEDIYGFDILFEAIKSLKFSEEVLFIFIDVNGIYKKRYSNNIDQINHINYKAKIIYLTSGLNIESLLNITDVFVRATRTDGDSIAVREALNSGARAVASDCVIRPDGCMLFRTNDSQELALKISDALLSEKKVFPQQDNSDQLFSLYLEN